MKLIKFEVGDLLLRKFPMPEGKDEWQTGIVSNATPSLVNVKWLPQPNLAHANAEEIPYLKKRLLSMIIGGSIVHSGKDGDE